MATGPSGEATSRLARVLVPIVLGILFLGRLGVSRPLAGGSEICAAGAFADL